MRRIPEAHRSRMIIVFTKLPIPGRAKTRMIPLLGENGSAKLHRQMTEHTLETVRNYCRRGSATVEIRFEGGDEADMASWLGSGMCFVPQGEGDLGERMMRAHTAAFVQGAGEIVIVGTDCPDMTAGTLERAFRSLENHDVVLGPASDGGYYLIGMRLLTPALFEGIDWGTGKVMEQTIEKLESLSLEFALLEELDDVDRPDDYRRWKATRGE